MGPEGQCVQQRGACRGTRGGVARPALWAGEEVRAAYLAEGVWGEFIQVSYFPASWVMKTQGGGSGRSLPGTSKTRGLFLPGSFKSPGWRSEPWPRVLVRDGGVGPGVIEGLVLRWGWSWSVWDPLWDRSRPAHPHPPAWLPGADLDRVGGEACASRKSKGGSAGSHSLGSVAGSTTWLSSPSHERC